MELKIEHLHFRITKSNKELIKEAATELNKDITEFIVDTMVKTSSNILKKRKIYK